MDVQAVTMDEALNIAEGLVVTDIATPAEIAEAILKAWSEGFAAGDADGYANGYTNGCKDADRVGE